MVSDRVVRAEAEKEQLGLVVDDLQQRLHEQGGESDSDISLLGQKDR